MSFIKVHDAGLDSSVLLEQFSQVLFSVTPICSNTTDKQSSTINFDVIFWKRCIMLDKLRASRDIRRIKPGVSATTTISLVPARRASTAISSSTIRAPAPPMSTSTPTTSTAVSELRIAAPCSRWIFVSVVIICRASSSEGWG